MRQNQTIQNVLNDVADRIEEDSWRIKREGGTTLFE